MSYGLQVHSVIEAKSSEWDRTLSTEIPEWVRSVQYATLVIYTVHIT